MGCFQDDGDSKDGEVSLLRDSLLATLLSHLHEKETSPANISNRHALHPAVSLLPG